MATTDGLAALCAIINELVAAYLQPTLSEVGLNQGTFELLSAIHATGGQAAQIEIARRLGITAPSLSEAVKLAVREGLVRQIADVEDARRKRLELTGKGRRAVARVLEAVQEAESHLIGGLDAVSLRTAQLTLKQAARSLAAAAQRAEEVHVS